MSVFQLLQYSRVTQAVRTKTKQRKTTPGCYSMPTGGTWLYKSFPEARRAGDHFYLVFLHHFPLPIRHIRGRVTFLNNKPEHVSPLPVTFSGSLITLKRIRSSWPSKIRPGMFLQPALLGRPQCFLWEVLCASHLNQPSSPSPAPFSITCLPNSRFIFFLESTALWNCYQMQFTCPTRCEVQRRSMEQRKVYCRTMQEESGLMYSPNPKLWKGFSKVVLKIRRGREIARSVISWCMILWLMVR